MMRSRFDTKAFAILVLCQAVQGAVTGVTLVRQGRPQLAILTPDKPSPAESLAAERLQHYVERMSGVRLTVAVESEAGPGPQVYLGRTRACRSLIEELQRRNVPEEASLIAVGDQGVRIAGVDDPGLVHATYFLLEELGCRWYFPTDWGIVVPRREDLVVTNGETYRAPDFAIRAGLHGYSLASSRDPSWDVAEWGRGNHLGGWRWWGAGHSYRHLVSHGRSSDHPEWYALVGGKRQTSQLCTTHPEVRRAALATIRRHVDAPNARLLCVSPNDGHGFCKCGRCKTLVPPRGGSIDRIVELGNFVAAAIREQYPEHYVTYYCDYHSVGTPTLVKPAKNTVFWIVQWAQDQFHGVTPETRMGRSLDTWGRFGNPIFLYTYYGSYGVFTFWPQVHAIANDIPYYHRKGALGLYSETHRHWGTQHLNFIVFPRLLWDADADVEGWVGEFCDTFYGPASGPMRRYYKLLEDTAQNGPAQFHMHSDIIAAFNADVLTELRALMKQAWEAVTGGNDVYRERMEFVAAGFRLCDLYLSANHLRRDYVKTRDRSIRSRMIEKYREALALVRDPRYANRLTENRISERALERELTALEQGTEFGIGRFTYSDYYVRGGRSGLDAARRSGITEGVWGLDMHANATGEIVYEMRARQGVFGEARLTRLNLPSRLVTVEVAVGKTVEGPWRTVAASELDDSGRGTRLSLPVDLTPLIKRRPRFFLRIALSNKTGTYCCALTHFGIAGEVIRE